VTNQLFTLSGIVGVNGESHTIIIDNIVSTFVAPLMTFLYELAIREFEDNAAI